MDTGSYSVPKLWVHVRSATLDDPDPTSVQVSVKVGSDCQLTQRVHSPNPHWNEDFLFLVPDMNTPLQVELHKTKALCRRQLMGLATISLYTVRHSNKPGEGHWSCLFLRKFSSTLQPTKHQIQLDTHFELPMEDSTEALDEKLQRLDAILEKEMEILETQHYRLITGDLTPPNPRKGAQYIYPEDYASSSRSPSPSPFGSDEDSQVVSTRQGSRHRHAMRSVRPKSRHVDREQELVVQKAHADTNRWKEIVGTPRFQKRMEEIRVQPKARSSSSRQWSQLVEQLSGLHQMAAMPVSNGEVSFTASTALRSRCESVMYTRQLRMRDRKHLDNDLRIQLYKRTLESLVYPTSEVDAHNFEKWTAMHPKKCAECSSLLWGVKHQGVKCTRCGKIVHDRCQSLVRKDCFHIDNEHSSSTVDQLIMAMSDKMNRTVSNHSSMFTMLSEAFNVPEKEHDKMVEETKMKILDMAQDFQAEVKVKVVAAQGLNLSRISAPKIYVTVVVEGKTERTRTFKSSGLPKWNEEFTFTCYSYHDPIKIRVWNERDKTLAALAQRFTKESDHFLGEKIIEVRRVGAPRDVWYKLDKRTEEREVSGSLNLNISAKVHGDEEAIPYHDQYMKLHEQLFTFLHFNKGMKVHPINPKPSDGETGENVKVMPSPAQDILDEFALKYGIEPIYRMMVHMSLLVHHHSLEGALSVLASLLKKLKDLIFLSVAEYNSIRAAGFKKLLEELFESCNFGRDNFARTLESLVTSLRLDLQQYREVYAWDNSKKVKELSENCKLLSDVITFQQQAMHVLMPRGKLDDMILDSMKESLRSTFDFLVQSSRPTGWEGHPGLYTEGRPFQFFEDLMGNMRSMIKQDKQVYGPQIEKYVNFSLWEVSVLELWRMFGVTVTGLFEEKGGLELYPPDEYIKFAFKVKNFYDSEVVLVPSRGGQECARVRSPPSPMEPGWEFVDMPKSKKPSLYHALPSLRLSSISRPVVPEHPQWCVRPVSRWIRDYGKKAIKIVDNAWEDDLEKEFPSHMEQHFSSSTYDMFLCLHKGFEVVSKLDTENTEIRHKHREDYAMVIREVVQHYVDKIGAYLPECVSDLKKACMMLNNLLQLAVNVQNLYEDMGGKEVNPGEGATRVLQDFQENVLKLERSTWSNFVAKSLTDEIHQAVGEVQKELIKVKGQGKVERQEAKVVLTPLLNVLQQRFIVIASTCEHMMLRKVIKNLSLIVLEALLQMVLPILDWEQEGQQATASKYQSYNYTTRQIEAFETCLDVLKEFFIGDAEREGLDRKFMEKHLGRLKRTNIFYRQTSDMLISDFFKDSQKKEHSDTSCGEVFIEIDTSLHPATREVDGTIRVISASNLKPLQGVSVLRPCIELNLVGPNSCFPSGEKKKFVTPVKSTLSPNFNDSFSFNLSSADEVELQVTAKHRFTFGLRSDRVIGVGVNPLKAGRWNVGLGPSLPMSYLGRMILCVLSVRTNSEIAKEFVAIKKQRRSYGEEVEEDNK